jgi:DNA-binding transcriptional regulator YhcF (GntR family)
MPDEDRLDGGEFFCGFHGAKKEEHSPGKHATRKRAAADFPSAPGPLYQQIVDGVRRAVSEGRLEPGIALPSFRVLAAELMVSLITVKRAYEELEREGITLIQRQGTRARVLFDRKLHDLDKLAALGASDLTHSTVNLEELFISLLSK